MSDSNLRIFREKLLLDNPKHRWNFAKKKKKMGKEQINIKEKIKKIERDICQKN